MSTAAAAPDVFECLNLYALRTLYRYAALALADPHLGTWQQLTDDRWQQLVVAAAALLRDDPAAQPSEPGWGELPVQRLRPGEVFAALPTAGAAWNDDYERVFGLLASGNCPPYETEYIDSKLSFQRAQALADIAGFYRAFGWTPSSEHPERPDHIALELEFLATLCDMQARASQNDVHDGEERAAVCRDAQAKFLAEHLLWWAPAFARLLAHADPKGPYAAIGRFLTSLLPAHRALLNLPSYSGPQRPSRVEPPEECDGCLLQPGLSG
jgi:TorA maturation chaperone TorD